MAWQRCNGFIKMLLLAALGSFAEHPCENEVKVACPDRPSADVARCLKDPSEHETPVTVSSECTDFIALNVACEETINTYCDGMCFSADTVLCLQKWVDQDSISPKCAGVMSWALPQKDEAGESPTDELGLSAEDYAEKKAWQAKRKGQRVAAVERMRETEKEKTDRQLRKEQLKKEYPDRYMEMLEQEEMEFKRAEEQKRRDRILAAALERKRREEEGLPEEDPEAERKLEKQRSRRRVKTSKENWLQENWLQLVLGLLGIMFVLFNILNFFRGDADEKDD